MMTEDQREQMASRAEDDIEVEALAETFDEQHHDQYGHYSHELSDDAAEAASRALIRVVPIAYGVLLGALADNLFLGLSIGLLLSAGLDFWMGDESVVRAIVQRLFPFVCPYVASGAQALAAAIGRLGITPPGALSGLQCAGPHL